MTQINNDGYEVISLFHYNLCAIATVILFTSGKLPKNSIWHLLSGPLAYSKQVSKIGLLLTICQ